MSGPRSYAMWRCPYWRNPAYSAAAAELSGQLGSLEAAWAQLAGAQAARRALTEAERDRMSTAVAVLTRRAESRRRLEGWFAEPLKAPKWVDGDGWPEHEGRRPS